VEVSGWWAGFRLSDKDHFDIDLDAEQVTRPAGHAAAIRRNHTGGGLASFGPRRLGLPKPNPTPNNTNYFACIVQFN
jgi:hypothetical protein